jgi:hypothetical protein
MSTLHTFGCSITQGFALPDVVNPILDDRGALLPTEQVQHMIDSKQINWEDIHLYQPSQFAWPQVLADRLGMSVINHARRGACFQQIARQCVIAQHSIQPEDVIIVMWTYMSRLSLQWPARTTVPFCNVVDPSFGWKTVILGFNKFFGLSHSDNTSDSTESYIQQYIEKSTKDTYLNPMGVYNRYYNSMVLQQITDGFLRGTGARVIHLSVETEPLHTQLESARNELDSSLKAPYRIPNPKDWHTVKVNHTACAVILDPTIPPAENDMHPSVQHHSRFADHLHRVYFA